jgi:hypothetical protein
MMTSGRSARATLHHCVEIRLSSSARPYARTLGVLVLLEDRAGELTARARDWGPVAPSRCAVRAPQASPIP